MAKVRHIRFDYFKPVLCKFEWISDPKNNKKKVKKITDEVSYDFINLMTELKNMEILEREIYHNQEKIRMDKIRVDVKSDYGVVHFTRLRDTNIPAITKEMEEELADLGLESNEFIAEGVSCIYDDEINILMVQRNIYSVSPSGIEFYLNYFHNNENEYIELRSVCYEQAFTRGKSKENYRSINLKTANGDKNPSLFNMDNPISKAFKELKELDGLDIEIIVKAPRNKQGKLNKKRISEVLNDFEGEKKYLSKAEITFKESDEAKVEKIDLLKGKIFTFLPFTVVPKKFLNPDVVETDMINAYSQRDGIRDEIIKNLGKLN